MMKYVRSVMSLKTDRRGVTAVEYGIMAALIATVLVTVVGSFAGGLSSVFNGIATSLSSNIPGGKTTQ